MFNLSEVEPIVPVLVGIVTAIGTFWVAKSKNSTDLEKEMQKVNVQNAATLYEQYMKLNTQLQEKVDKLEDRVEKLQEKYEKEINFYKSEIERMEIQIDGLEDENQKLREESEKLKIKIEEKEAKYGSITRGVD